MKKTLNKQEMSRAVKKHALSNFATLVEAADFYNMPETQMYNIIYGNQYPTDKLLLVLGYEKVTSTVFKRVEK